MALTESPESPIAEMGQHFRNRNLVRQRVAAVHLDSPEYKLHSKVLVSSRIKKEERARAFVQLFGQASGTCSDRETLGGKARPQHRVLW